MDIGQLMQTATNHLFICDGGIITQSSDKFTLLDNCLQYIRCRTVPQNIVLISQIKKLKTRIHKHLSIAVYANCRGESRAISM